MGNSSLPYNYKQPMTDTTVMSIDGSASVVTQGGMSMSGKATFFGGVNLASTPLSANVTAHFETGLESYGRIQLGTSAADLGDVVLCRTVRVSGANTKQQVVLPQGADIVDIKLFIQTAPEASAGSTVDFLVGTTVQDSRFARFTNVSAQGHYGIATSVQTSAWDNVSGAACVLQISATGMSGVIASGTQGKIQVFYVKTQ